MPSRKTPEEKAAGKQRLREATQRLERAKDAAARRAMGPPLERTDADLDALSTITEADLDNAVSFWKEAAPAPYKNLLDAEPDHGD